MTLLIAFALVGLYWLHDKGEFPAFRRFCLRHRRTALFLGWTERAACYLAAWLSIAAGLDFAFRLIPHIGF